MVDNFTIKPKSDILKVLFLRDCDEILRTVFSTEGNKFADRLIDRYDLAHRLMDIGWFTRIVKQGTKMTVYNIKTINYGSTDFKHSYRWFQRPK